MPILFICAVPFFSIHGWATLKQFSLSGVGIFALISLIGIIVHELIHAVVFALFSPRGFASIRFGIDRKTWSPFCHATDIMRVWVYRSGALAPMVVLGIIPTLVSFLNGDLACMIFGFVFTMAAGGDVLSVWMTRELSNGDIIKDHSSKLGFYIINREITK